MYLVSSCLAGVNCRYNGGNSEHKVIVELVKEGKGLTTELLIQNDIEVYTENNLDILEAILCG